MNGKNAPAADKPDEERRDGKDPAGGAAGRMMGDYATVGLMFPVSIALGATMGYFLDQWLHTQPWLLAVFTFYGVAAGFWNLFKVTRSHERKKQ